VRVVVIVESVPGWLQSAAPVTWALEFVATLLTRLNGPPYTESRSFRGGNFPVQSAQVLDRPPPQHLQPADFLRFGQKRRWKGKRRPY
jgi:hypothetical protein